jgi:glutamate/tyrosine decarboxylase-like PLP-dependent enzyme
MMTNEPEARGGGAGATPFATSGEEFRALGHHLVDRIAGYIDSLPTRRVAPDTTPAAIRALVGQEGLPEHGADAKALIDQAADLLFDYVRHSGHPRSWGYIAGSPAPMGMLADFLASAVNPNVAAWDLVPAAAEIEAQAVRWVAELLGYPTDCGGLFVSGGNMGNIVGTLAARRSRADWDLRAEGVAGAGTRRMRLYASPETHTWLHKAADIAGLGTNGIRWIETDSSQRMDPDALARRIEADAAAGDLPFLVIGTAGTVSTGAVDPLPALAAIARAHDCWFHVDGAYGAFAVASRDAPADLAGLREADSLAVDAHKWLFAPVEAGCALVRDRRHLLDTFDYAPPYYHYKAAPAEEVTHYYKLGPQNSRAFRALKVWLTLRHVGRAEYVRVLEGNIRLSRQLHGLITAEADFEAFTQSLSIATFRYVPPGLGGDEAAREAYLDDLNAALVTRVQKGGDAFISNAVLDGRFVLRTCITNFRSTEADVCALPSIIRDEGRALDAEMRPAALETGA